MKKNTFILSSFLLILLAGSITSCTNSEPKLPTGTSSIACSVDSLKFASAYDTVDFYIYYTGGGGSLSWSVSSKPDWVLLQPASGYITSEKLYVVSIINLAELHDYSPGTYTGKVVLYSSEGTRDIGVKLNYAK